MTTSRALFYSLLSCSLVAWSACVDADAENASGAMAMGGMQHGNIVTGEGFPNPNPVREASWGTLPEGREWGSTAGIDIDPTDGHVWAYERCGSGSAGGPGVNCQNNPVDPIFKFDRNTGEILANFGAGIFVTPHGIHADSEGNVWVTDFAGNGEKGHQVHKFSPTGELLMSIGIAGQAGNSDGMLNQPNDVIVAPDRSIFIGDGHGGQGMTTEAEIREGRESGATGRILKYSPDGQLIMEWGQIGYEHGEFRTPHALEFDSQGRLWIADRGNHRLEIYDQQGNYLESRYSHGRISGLYITDDDQIYTIDSESTMISHPNWSTGVRIGPVSEDVITGFIPPWPGQGNRIYSGNAGEGIAVDQDGNVFAAEGPASLGPAGAAFTRYSKGM